MANFIPTDSFPDVPSLEDGKPANAAYLNAPHQALVNRTHNLNETLRLSGLTRQGATRIRFVEDPAEMAATLDVKRSDVCVASNAGAYVYWGPLGGSPAPAPWAYESTTHPGSYWVHSTFGITDRAGAPFGLVTRDADGRIPADTAVNGIVALKSAAGSVLNTAKGGDDWLVVDGLSVAVNVLPNDIVDLDVSLNAMLGGGVVHGWVCLAMQAAPPLVPLAGSRADVTAEARNRVTTHARWTAAAAATVTFVVAIKADSPNAVHTITAIGDAIARATVYRP